MVPLKYPNMTDLMVNVLECHGEEKKNMHWYLHMDLNMDSDLGLIKELIWVVQLSLPKGLIFKKYGELSVILLVREEINVLGSSYVIAEYQTNLSLMYF